MDRRFLLLHLASLPALLIGAGIVLAPDGRVSPAGTMAVPRAAQTATPLADGRVLLAGGMTGNQKEPAAGAEIYDVTTGRFSHTGAMLIPRHSHSATLLPDGRVLIAGGYDAAGRYLKSAELYDPRQHVFTPAGSMHEARAGHVAEVLKDGRVVLIGGVGDGWTFLSSAEIYDPETGSFTPTGSMLAPRESHAAVRLPDGRIFVVGGHAGRRRNITLYRDAELYNPDTGTFAPAGEMTVRRHKHDAVLLQDGRVLITGGSDERDMHGSYTSAELYNPVTRRFTRTRDMMAARYKHEGTSVVLPDGQVLIAGGAARAELFDPQTNAFRLVAGDAGLAGQFSAAARLPDGRVLITGGYGEGTGPRMHAWIYQP